MKQQTAKSPASKKIVQPARARAASKAASRIRFSTKLMRPADAKTNANGVEGVGEWSFLILPKQASAKLPSRGMVSVEGTLNGSPFKSTLDPDGDGGHWLKVDRKLREAASVDVGEAVTLEITPVAPDQEPEPEVPPDLRKALAAAPKQAKDVWSDITPAARRDFIHWITSPKKPETRVKRVATACDLLAKGKRRPCCFDRSGMYDKSLSCPIAAPE